MKIQEHLGKLTWSFADKSIFLMWGIIVILQMRAMEPDEYGILALLISIYSWIFSVAESLSVQMIIQFGSLPENRPKLNLISLILFVSMSFGITCVFFALQNVIVDIFHEPRFIKIAYILPILTLVTIPRFFSMKFMYRDRVFHKLFIVDLAYFGTMTGITIYKLIINKNLYFSDLVSMYIIGAIASSTVGLILVRKELVFSRKGNIRIKDILRISIPLTMYNSLNNMPKYLDTVLIQYFFSATAVGIYQMAKNIFRVFDEACNTAGSVIYPAAIRLISFKNNKGLNDLVTKAVSFVFVGFIFIVFFLELGFTNFFIGNFLPKYHQSASLFNLLIIAAFPLTFIVLSGIMTAAGKPQIVFKYVLTSIIGWFVTMVIVGKTKNPSLIPLAQILYTTIFGTLCYFYAKRNFDFKPKQIFRAFGDSYNFLLKFKKS